MTTNHIYDVLQERYGNNGRLSMDTLLKIFSNDCCEKKEHNETGETFERLKMLRNYIEEEKKEKKNIFIKNCDDALTRLTSLFGGIDDPALTALVDFTKNPKHNQVFSYFRGAISANSAYNVFMVGYNSSTSGASAEEQQKFISLLTRGILAVRNLVCVLCYPEKWNGIFVRKGDDAAFMQVFKEPHEKFLEECEKLSNEEKINRYLKGIPIEYDGSKIDGLKCFREKEMSEEGFVKRLLNSYSGCIDHLLSVRESTRNILREHIMDLYVNAVYLIFLERTYICVNNQSAAVPLKKYLIPISPLKQLISCLPIYNNLTEAEKNDSVAKTFLNKIKINITDGRFEAYTMSKN